MDNVVWIGLAIGSGGLLLWPMLTRGVSGAKNASINDAVLLINRENAAVLDVREVTEFATGHIQGAINIPVAQLAERVAELKKYQDKPLLVNCQGGVRSQKACGILAKHEFKQLHNLSGGMSAWAQANMPTVK